MTGQSPHFSLADYFSAWGLVMGAVRWGKRARAGRPEILRVKKPPRVVQNMPLITGYGIGLSLNLLIIPDFG
jgi:hypothetical protein